MTANQDKFGVYPTADSFDAGPTTLDSGVLQGFWSRFEPWSANLTFGANTFWQTAAASQIYATSSADIHNGFFGTVGSGSTASYLSSGPAAASANNNNTIGALCGYQFRDYSVADVDVRGSFRFSSRGLNYQTTVANARFGFALAARLNGTISGSGTADTRMSSINGYIFGLFGGAGTGGSVLDIRYFLIKVVAGTPTIVANSIGFASTSGVFPGNGTNPDRNFRLTVVNSGPNVVLTGYLINSDGSSTSLLTYTDTSSPITTAGRVGFILANENSSHIATPSGPMSHLCNWFEARPNGGSVVLREYWERFLPRGGRLVTPATGSLFPHSLTKHSLMNGWVGDRTSYDSPSLRPYEISLKPDSANNRIKGQAASNGGVVYSFSQRLATDPQFQDRQVAVTFENAGPAVARQAGVILFGTPGNSNYATNLYAIPKCYLAQIVYNSGGTFDLKLFRVRGDIPGFTQLAVKTGVSLALGTTYTLRFSAETLTTPTPETGYVKLRVYINGTQQTWDAAAGVYTQWEIRADGSLIDRGTNRISSGLGQGIQFTSSTVLTANVFFDSWAAAAGDTTFSEPGQDQVTIAVAAENDSASGTFSVPYDWSATEESGWLTNDHKFDSDHRYVGATQSRTRTRYSIGCNAATASEVSTLQSFYTSHNGVEIPFTWSNPKGTSVTVRFVDDALNIEQLTPSVYRWSITLEEVLAE